MNQARADAVHPHHDHPRPIRFAMLNDGPLLPSNAGATFRFLETMRVLHESGHDVTLVHADRGWVERQALARLPYRVVLVNPQDLYLSNQLTQFFEERQFDWVQTQDEIVITSLINRNICPSNTGLVFECHDLPNSNGRQVTPQQLAAQLADLTICVSEDEAQALRGKAPRAYSIESIPCSISRAAMRPPKPLHTPPIFGFIGNLFYGPNQEAIEWISKNVWPRIKAEVPDAELRVFGNVPESVRSACATPGIEFRGFVDDAVAELAECTVGLSVVLTATGFRVKVLHYVAAGLPVVANELGVGGIGTRAPFAMAETAAEMAAQCVRLYRDPKLAHELALGAQQWVASRLCTEAHAVTYDKLWARSAALTQGAERDRFEHRLVEARDVWGAELVEELRLRLLDATPVWLAEMLRLNRFRTSESRVSPGTWLEL